MRLKDLITCALTLLIISTGCNSTYVLFSLS